MILTISNLVKKYNDLTVLKSLNFELTDNEIVGLCGPNGAGKTTLLRIIANLLTADQGTVKSDQKLKGRVALVPEYPDLFPLLTVAEHFKFMSMALDIANFQKQQDYLLELFQLQDKKDAFIGELSKGMRQKVMIALNLIRETDVLLLDEPFSGLDPRSIYNLREIIKELKATGRIILIASHNLESIEKLAQRILIMSGGLIIKDAGIDDLFAEIKAKNYLSLEELFLEVTDPENN